MRMRCWAVLAVLALVAWPNGGASAQNLFDALFGGMHRPAPPVLPPQAQPYAPSSLMPPLTGDPSVPDRIAPASTGRHLSYCVRTCDGRFFPVERNNGLTPLQACKSFCPASPTKVFAGASIDHAIASDGSRYGDLANAFLYRKKLVAGCTCNGRDAFGLVPLDVAADSTLRAGDIVATPDGLMAYRGRPNATRATSFGPIDATTGLSPEQRRTVALTRVGPGPSTLAGAVPLAADADERQAQLVR